MAQVLRRAPAGGRGLGDLFLTGPALKRLLPWAAIGDWTLAATGLEPWMLEECWAAVGDGAEDRRARTRSTADRSGGGR